MIKQTIVHKLEFQVESLSFGNSYANFTDADGNQVEIHGVTRAQLIRETAWLLSSLTYSKPDENDSRALEALEKALLKHCKSSDEEALATD